MEHLEYPKDCLPLDFRIPALAEEQDIQWHSLAAAASRFGFSLNQDGLLTFEEMQRCVEPREAPAFVQEWLYFETLQYVLGDDYSYQEFVRSDGDTRYITTAKLKDYELAQPPGWNYAKGVRHARKRGRAYDRWELVSKQLAELDKPWDAAGDHWPLVMLSISLLSWLFICRPWNVEEFTYRRPRNMHSASTEFLRNLFVSRPGWCTHEFTQLRHDFSDEQLIYLACIRRYPRPWVDHTRCQSITKCVGYNIDNETFKGFHTEDGCNCSRVEAPVEDMYAILRDGGIPYIQCSFDKADQLHLQYRRATPCTRFIAVSHLWADGLGNPSGNSLYQCQLYRLLFQLRSSENFTRRVLFTNGLSSTFLFHFVKQAIFKGVCAMSSNDKKTLPAGLSWSSIMEPGCVVNFWLDVYSIPIPLSGDQRANEMLSLKQKALSNMTLTYALAQSVLAIDHEFEHIDLEMDETEILARIALSGWNSRCWTFQEAVLANFVVYWCGSFPAAIPPWSRMRKAFTGEREVVMWALAPSPRRTDSTIWLGELVSLLKQRVEPPSSIYGYLDSMKTLPKLTGDGPSFDTRLVLNNPTPGPQNPGWKHLLRAEHFVWIWNALRLRTTTKAEDLAMILANLLGMDGSEILALSQVDRMRAILKSCRVIPADVIFRHAGTGRTDPIPEQVYSLHQFEDAETGCGFADITPNGITLLPGLPHSKRGIPRRPWRLVRVDRTALTWDSPRCCIPFRVWDQGAYQATNEILVSPCSYDLSKFTEASGPDVYLVLGSYDSAPLVKYNDVIDDLAQYGMCLVQPRVDGPRLIAAYAFPITWYKFSLGDTSTAAVSMPDNMEVMISLDVESWPRPVRVGKDIVGRTHGNESWTVMMLVIIVASSGTIGIWWALFIRFMDPQRMSVSAVVVWSLVIALSLYLILTLLCMLILQIVRSAQHWLSLLEYDQPNINRIPWWLALLRARPDANSRPYVGGGGFSLYAIEPMLLACKLFSAQNRIWHQLAGYFRGAHDGEIALEQTDQEQEQQRRREREEQSRWRLRAWKYGTQLGNATFTFAKERLLLLFTIPMGWVFKLSDAVAEFQVAQNERRSARRQEIRLD